MKSYSTYHPYNVKLEEEMEMTLLQDDVDILQQRYIRYSHSNLKQKLQSQWTRNTDAVQEHFSSHIILENPNGGENLIPLPKEIYAMKRQAKESWVLYKKRECERRKRIRRKIAEEKEKEDDKKPSNLLLALVDRCEFCKRFYITVNLFWGITLCDVCYFNEAIIHEIMKKQKEKRYESYSPNIDFNPTTQSLSFSPPPPPPLLPPSLPPPPTYPFIYPSLNPLLKDNNPFEELDQTKIKNYFSPPVEDRETILLEKQEDRSTEEDFSFLPEGEENYLFPNFSPSSPLPDFNINFNLNMEGNIFSNMCHSPPSF